MRNHVLKIILFGVLQGWCSETSTAKGLDEIQPRTPEEKGEPAKPTNPGAPTAPGAANTEQKPITGAAVVVEKSKLSLAIENKLSFGIGAGFVRIPKAKQGEFHAAGGADVFVAYSVWKNESGSQQMLSSFRYMPIEADARIKSHAYSGIIEGYHAGGVHVYQLTQTLLLKSSLEIGYLLVYLNQDEKYSVNDSYEKNAIAFTVGSGLDWMLQEKLNLGPRIYFGFGDYQTIQFTGAATVLF